MATRVVVSWTSFDVTNVPTRVRVSWTAFDVANVATRAVVSWVAFDVTALAALPGGAIIVTTPSRLRRKRSLKEILAGLRPVVQQIRRAAPKRKITAAAVRSIRRAKARHRLDELAEQIGEILSDRADYDRDIVLAAIVAARVLRMEEEEAAVMLLLAV